MNDFFNIIKYFYDIYISFHADLKDAFIHISK